MNNTAGVVLDILTEWYKGQKNNEEASINLWNALMHPDINRPDIAKTVKSYNPQKQTEGILFIEVTFCHCSTLITYVLKINLIFENPKMFDHDIMSHSNTTEIIRSSIIYYFLVKIRIITT